MSDAVDDVCVTTPELESILKWGVEDFMCTKQRVESLIRAVLEARQESARLGVLLMERNLECNDDLERLSDLQEELQERAGQCCLIEGRCEHGGAGFDRD